MTVRDLIAELQKWPPSAPVHIDVMADDGTLQPTEDSDHDEFIASAEELASAINDRMQALGGWEGDRVVRGVSGVRWQSGYKAVALDAQTYKESEADEANWIPQEHDTEPTEG